jgi:hypothetical protein
MEEGGLSGFLFQNERVLFLFLALFVWAFIAHTIWSSVVTRRQLQREIDALPSTTDGDTKKEENEEKDDKKHR